MPTPWDRPPFPKRGNLTQRALYEAIGRTLNAWEEIEISMAHLYAAFATGDRFDPAANHAYGVEANFNQRLAALQRVAEQYFMRHPSQDVEGEFCRLTRFVVGYSARRNDIAHSHALLSEWVIEPGSPQSLFSLAGKHRWCLVPPHFRANKFTPNKRPAYALTSWEINEFGTVFWDIAHALSNLSIWVIQHVPIPSHGIRPRPGALPYTIRDPRIRRG